MSQNHNSNENGFTWIWRIKVTQAVMGSILSYLFGAGTVYAVTQNYQKQEAVQSQKFEQVICPLQPPQASPPT